MKILLTTLAIIGIGWMMSPYKNYIWAETKTVEKPKSPEECHKKHGTNTINNTIVKCINEIGK